MKKTLFTLVSLIAVAPSAVLAHPGHDHNSPYALLIHLAWITPLVVAVALFSYKHKAKNKN